MAPRRANALAILLLLPSIAIGQVDQQELQAELRQILSLEQMGRLAQARAALDRLLEVAPAEPAAILAAERICRRQGELERVLPLVAEAVQLEPDAVVLRQVQLRVLADLGDREGLRAAGQRWLENSPRLAEAYREYAVALERTGDRVGAERVLQSGLAQLAPSLELRAELADLYLRGKRWPEAAEQWYALLHESPSLGWQLISYKLDSLDDAGLLATAIVDRWGSEEEFARLAAIAAVYAKRPEEARRAAEMAAAGMDRQASRTFLDQFAQVSGRHGQPALVAWAYRQVLQGSDNSANWSLARQIVSNELSAGDTASAREVLDDFMSRADTVTSGHRWAAAMRIRLESAADGVPGAAEALADFGRLYPDDPELPALALAVAEAGLRRGELDAASQAIGSVTVVDIPVPLQGRFAVTRGYLALQAGDDAKARAEFEIAAATLSGAAQGEAMRFLVFLRDGNERELRAVAAAQPAALRHEWLEAFDGLMGGLRLAAPSEARPALLLWAGELAIAGHAVERAASVLSLIPQNHPEAGEAPVALLKLADAYSAAGRSADAIKTLEQLILEYPESALTPIGRRQLAELRAEVPRS